MLAHTLGIPYDLDEVTAFTRRHNLWLIEDCCDAVGATYQGRKVGTFGDLATVSFYPAHHITMGEGGCVLDGPTAAEDAGRVLPRLGPGLLVQPGQGQTRAESASNGNWAICPSDTITSTPTRTSGTT